MYKSFCARIFLTLRQTKTEMITSRLRLHTSANTFHQPNFLVFVIICL